MERHFSLFILLIITLIGCDRQATKEVNSKVSISTAVAVELEIPDISKDKSELNFDNKTSRWLLNDSLYSGYAVGYFPDSTLLEQFGILNGKKQNKSIMWYEDGHLRQLAHYHLGKLHGPKKSWSPDDGHTLIASYNFEQGKPHGEQKKWYNTGELFKVLNLNMGKEEGLQQAYRKNGALFANYEARNGRIFGLKKAALCFSLEDQKLK